MRKTGIAIAVAILVVAGLLLSTASGRAAARAALLVAGLFAPQGITPLSLMASEPEVGEVMIATEGEPVPARLFEPAGDGPFGALILVAGYPSDIEDLQLSTVAADLARMGIVTLVPRLPALRQGGLSTQDVTALVDSYEWLAGRPNVAPTHIGYAGFCVGSSLALLAAEDARINEDVRLVNVFGGYFDLATFLHAAGTRSYPAGERRVEWHPAPDTLRLILQNSLAQLPVAERPALEEYLREGAEGEPPASLSQLGRLAAAFVTPIEPDEMDTLLAQLPADYQAHLAALSPNRNIDSLRARVFIMHDASDPYIPVAESYRLAEAIGDPGRVSKATFDLFAHVRPRRAADRLILVRDGFKLIGYLDDVLGAIMPSP